MTIRELIFWTFDFMQGGKVNYQLRDIKYKFNNGVHHDALQNILSHAIQFTHFYKNFDKNNFNSFPIINKTLIRNEIDDFICHLVKKEQLFKAITSGSTGTPFIVFHDQEKKQRNTADTIFFAGKAGYKLGEPLHYFKIWNKINRKGPVKAFMENIIAQDVTSMSDHNIFKLLERLKKKKSLHFIGYSSAYDALINYIIRSEYDTKDIKIKSAIAMSEGISEETKKLMHMFFGVHCVSRYSNVENGIIAQQPIGKTYFEINHASYHVEILKMDKNEPAELGETGRIVVTDLYNFAMPLIRYDTGDVAIMEKNSATGINQLSKIEGRKMDLVYDTTGNLVSSFTITNQMWKYPEIIQYQFIQKEKKKYLFILNIDKPFVREPELIEEFKIYFGSDADFFIEYVNEIPLLNSGKRKKVINEYKSL